IYSMVAELQRDDPKNLYERLTQIKAPIFLAFGDKEPFIPGPAFNGLTDLGRDIITPFMTRMTNAGNRPILKIYPNTGHFIHTDNPVEYPADVVDFVTRGTVDASSPLATDRMIHGALASALPVAPTPPGASPTAGLNKEGRSCHDCRRARSGLAGGNGEKATSPSPSSTAILPARTGSSSPHRCFPAACA
ncbi:MAG TPA: alpha/beta hydrolase, partial [Xanthobacteraceae bacterium]|nr:alpha/beta hydrolase [Xanthobacteraceae bacterium]